MLAAGKWQLCGLSDRKQDVPSPPQRRLLGLYFA
jgi:hypothetical protein